jgi:hydrogenase large subunit
MSRLIVGPFNRVEGDLEVRLDIEAGEVREAWVNSPLYRGFERMLAGKDPRDALVITPRICGICSVSQSLAAAMALAEAQGLRPPPNGELARNLVHAAENVADHITHFYMFFMPDFARAIYSGEPWHADVAARFKSVEGMAAREMLPARAAFMHLLGTLAGHWPHTLGLQPGGTTHAVDGAGKARVAATIATFRRFLETRLFGDRLETVAGLSSLAELEDWTTRQSPSGSDFAAFLRLASALSLYGLGRGTDRFLSYGAYMAAGRPLLTSGVYAESRASPLDPAAIAEDTAHAWYASDNGARHPRHGATEPDADAAAAYSWCKAPRLAGMATEVGALARQVVDGQPLVRALVARDGGNVAARIIARMIEVARIVPSMESWARRIEPGKPFYVSAPVPAEAEGAGMIEAARGSLGHWLTIREGRIAGYQIIAPTTWNFSPRDGSGLPGPCEQALVGAPVRTGEKSPVAVQHIVRSFDPCMVCTVH